MAGGPTSPEETWIVSATFAKCIVSGLNAFRTLLRSASTKDRLARGGAVVKRLPITAVIVVASCLATGAAAQTSVGLGYSGPDKTFYLIEQAKAVARELGKTTHPDALKPTIWIFADDDVFLRLRDPDYVKRRFGNSEALQREVVKENYEGRICAMLYALTQEMSLFFLIMVDSSLSKSEIDRCMPDMFRYAMKDSTL